MRYVVVFENCVFSDLFFFDFLGAPFPKGCQKKGRFEYTLGRGRFRDFGLFSVFS